MRGVQRVLAAMAAAVATASVVAAADAVAASQLLRRALITANVLQHNVARGMPRQGGSGRRLLADIAGGLAQEQQGAADIEIEVGDMDLPCLLTSMCDVVLPMMDFANCMASAYMPPEGHPFFTTAFTAAASGVCTVCRGATTLDEAAVCVEKESADFVADVTQRMNESGGDAIAITGAFINPFYLKFLDGLDGGNFNSDNFNPREIARIARASAPESAVDTDAMLAQVAPIVCMAHCQPHLVEAARGRKALAELKEGGSCPGYFTVVDAIMAAAAEQDPEAFADGSLTLSTDTASEALERLESMCN